MSTAHPALTRLGRQAATRSSTWDRAAYAVPVFATVALTGLVPLFLYMRNLREGVFR